MGSPRKLTVAQVLEAFTSSEGAAAMGARFGVHKKTILWIRRGRLYREITGMPAPNRIPAQPDLEGEEWRPVVGFEGRYDVSDMGRVRSLLYRGAVRSHPLVLSPHPATGGYLYVTLRAEVGGEPIPMRVHVLVLEAFVGPRPSPDHQARHGFAGKLVNRLDNLCWGTAQENADDRAAHGTTIRGEDSHLAKLTVKKVREIRRRAASGETLTSIGKAFGVNKQNVSQIVKRRTWKHA